MACDRSVNAWDIVVKKEKGTLFFDKRPQSRIGALFLSFSAKTVADGTSPADFLSVNENGNELPSDKDSINNPKNLRSGSPVSVVRSSCVHLLSCAASRRR